MKKKNAVLEKSKADFYAKFNIALKEASETAYWLELLLESGHISAEAFESITAQCRELICLLVAITKTQHTTPSV